MSAELSTVPTFTLAHAFRPASRKGVKPIIALYAESGCGKTYSALLLARGIAGPSGKVAMIDTESGRGSLYADVVPGGYDVMELSEFSPAHYRSAIDAADHAGVDVLVIDSMSHEWEGIGGVLDMAGENEQRSGKAGLHNWKTPKLEHNKLVLKLLQTRLIIICCIRAKYKSRQTKEGGRTVIVKDDHVSPIQSEEFIFEMTAHAEIYPNHTINLTKCSHPVLRQCFPENGKEPLTIAHGEAIARWAADPGVARHAAAKPAKVYDPAVLRGKIMVMLDKTFEDTAQYLWDEGFMDVDHEIFDELPAERLLEIGKAVKAKLEANQ